MTSTNSEFASASTGQGTAQRTAPSSHARWWGMLAGVALGIADTTIAHALGFTFSMNGHESGWLVGAFFGTSFAFLGFLIGYVVEGRQRDRHAAEVIQAQMATINAARARLVQSEKLAALGQLSATIAHEVRNPLAVIRSSAQSLSEMLPAEDRRHPSGMLVHHRGD